MGEWILLVMGKWLGAFFDEKMMGKIEGAKCMDWAGRKQSVRQSVGGPNPIPFGIWMDG
jgi:hypothetical protein